MADFVNFKLAQKLKEKGFREECLLHYTDTGNLFSNSIDSYYRPNQELDYSDFQECFNNGNSIGLVDAPTIYQVLKWLREDKKIHICIDIYDDGWFFDVASFYKEDAGVYEIKLPYKSSKVTPDYDSFEQAALAGIEYVLDNLI